MKNIPLDEEEQELLDAFDSGEFESTITPSRKKFIEELAAQASKKDIFKTTIYRT